MIIKSATRLAFATGCLAVITTLSVAHAQMGYWPPPGPYGPAPGAYGYGPPPGAYGPVPGTYAPICPAFGWNPDDNQRPADQPG